LCGIILCYSGIYISIFSNIILSYALTIIWVVGIMNSINMLDNMDGIATIVSICIFANAMLVIYLSGEPASVHFFILLGLVASLLGFLRFNWHPSKLYMGDTGSQILGMLLATIGIIYFWNNSFVLSRATSVAQQIVIVTITFILPLADTTIVVINRLLRKKSPFVGGRDHTTHNLFFRGVTEKRIAVLFGSIGLLSIGLVYIIESSSNVWENKMLAIFALFPVVLFIFLFSITKFKKATAHTAIIPTNSKIISNNREVVSNSSPVESATNGYPPYVEENLT
jgi:UDP-GlcNAc:undecaprenyl-phosphate GlcNAc-1-phosphate transferase